MLRQRRGSLTSTSKAGSTSLYEDITIKAVDEKMKKQSLHQKPKLDTEGIVADLKELLSESKRLAHTSSLSLITRIQTLASSLEFKDRVELNDLHTSDRILDVKRKIQRQMGIPVKQQILFCRGEELEDNTKTLEAYNIIESDKIYVISRPRR